jgi:hypothetical protein
MSETTAKKDGFVRWQQKTIDERGKAITLFLSMSFASVGFVITQLLKDDFEFSDSYAEILILLGTALQLISIILIIWLTLNRLKGFRLTTKIARINCEQEGKEEELSMLRIKNDKVDELTHFLFSSSLWTFGVAESLIVLGFIVQIWNKV